MKYPALIDGEAGAYGAVFPDLPGCVAMGCTVDEVVRNAEDSMRDWIASMEANG
ncbi:MAG: type II toxin-antitoxin system HicB family antitoxin [Chloroflexi bacterium]|nr:type II toxin-antitoxin system HicB family antitoxin [Chloroflexota bacterium]